MNADLKEIQDTLDQLNVDHGVWKTSRAGIRFRAIDDNARPSVIKSLIEIMKERGKEKFLFEMPSVQEMIADYFFPEERLKHASSSDRKSRYKRVAREVREASLEVYGRQSDDTKKELGPAPVAQPPTAYKAPAPKVEEPTRAMRKDMTQKPYEPSEALEVDAEFAKLLSEADDE